MKTTRGREPLSRTTVGWREWITLPDWGIKHLKAKIDTGARTSALHAFDIETFDRDGAPWARFTIHPWQDSAADQRRVEAPLLDRREVRSSSGTTRTRPVVEAVIEMAGQRKTVEVTLTRRDEMGFRMLVGRQALRRTYLVDPARSYLGGKPDPATLRRNRGRT
jgi:hypothetical protein